MAVLVFDLDDTLISWRSYVLSGFQAVDHWLQQEQAIAGFYAFAQAQFAAGKRKQMFDAFLASQRNTQQPLPTIEEMLTVYREHSPKLELYPDAAACLPRLGQKHALALITDGHWPTQQKKVQAVGLELRIPFIIYTDTLGPNYGKPHPASFQKVMAQYPQENDFVYIGDNPAKDFQSPNQLGWKTVRILRENTEHRQAIATSQEAQPQEIIEDLYNLKI